MVIRLALLLGLVGFVAPLSEAQTETPDDLAFVEELRRDYRRGGSWSAQRELAEYLLDYPHSATARQLAAEAALQRGRLAEAAEHLAALETPDPRLQARLLARQGLYQELMELATDDTLAPLFAARLNVQALDGLGHHFASLSEARAATDAVDDRKLDGWGLFDLGWLLHHQRRFEAANQALVYADGELNGLRGPNYELRVPEVLVELGRVYAAARQTGTGPVDRALSTLAEVLKVDANDPEALVVRALVFEYGRNGAAVEAALDGALSRDPQHPEALVLRGRTRLMARQPSVAAELAGQVLAVNPRHRGALALRAVASALSADEDKARVHRTAFDENHPESAEADRLLGEVLQAHYRFEESCAPLRRALALEPDDESPLPILAQSLANLGDFIEATEVLREHERRSPFPFPWRSNMLALLAARSELVEMPSTNLHFLLTLEEDERDIYGAELSAFLEDVRADMQARWGFAPEDDVQVEVYDRVADFSVRTVGFEGFLAFGVCFGNVVTIMSPQSELRGQLHWEQTALHEYAHVVTLGLSRQRMPRWLSEGISVQEERRYSDRWARSIARDVLQARANDLIFPVERLDEAFQDGRTVMLGYYLGSIAALVVERDFGFSGLRALVTAYAEDLETHEAIRQALGVEPAEIDKRILAYIDEELGSSAQIQPAYGERGKDRLRDLVKAGELEHLDDLAVAYNDLDRSADRDVAIARAERELGSTPTLQRLRARMALEQGDNRGALQILELWSLNPDDQLDPDALMWMAALLEQDGQVARAIATTRRARALFPEDVSPGSASIALLQALDPSEEDDREEWMSIAREVCRLDETTVAVRVMLIEELRDQADAQPEMLVLLRELVTLDPYDPDRRLEYGEVLELAGDSQLAGAQYQVALNLGLDQVPPASQEVPEGEEPGWRAEARRRLATLGSSEEREASSESSPVVPAEGADEGE